MEIFPNVHCIESAHKRRFVMSYLLIGERALLVDSGFPHTAKDTILPYLDRIGLPVAKVVWLVVTHASADHFGGNHMIKKRSPGTTIVAHQLDADSILSPATFIAEHFDALREYGLPHPAVNIDDPEFLARRGPATPVDWKVQGGERIDLGDDWSVTLLHAPGHTPGHLVVHDARHGAVFAGDAILGEGVPDVEGDLVMPPHYFEVGWYLQTIAKVRALSPQHILATHYKPLAGKAAKELIEASETFVATCERAIILELQGSKGVLSTQSLLERMRQRIGIPDADYQYGLLVRAHLKKLAAEGRVARIDKLDEICWQATA